MKRSLYYFFVGGAESQDFKHYEIPMPTSVAEVSIAVMFGVDLGFFLFVRVTSVLCGVPHTVCPNWLSVTQEKSDTVVIVLGMKSVLRNPAPRAMGEEF